MADSPTGEEKEKVVKQIRGILVITLLAVFAWQIFTAATVNETSRSVINRSDVDRQIRTFEKRVGE